MKIVFAEEKHLDRITEIEKAVFSLPWSKKSFMAELDDENTIFLAAEENGEAIGFAILHVFENEGEVYNIAVAEEHRRSGVGDMLMQRMLSEASARGVDTIFLDVRESNAAARKMYEKYGFYDLSVRKGYYDAPKEDAVIMIRIKA